MKNNNRSISKSIITIGLIILLSCSMIQIMPINDTPNENASAIKTWILEEKTDFENATLENLIMYPDGNIRLDFQLLSIEDDFKDLSNIDYKANVTWDKNNDKIGLQKIDNVFITAMGGRYREYTSSLDKTSDGGYAIFGSRNIFQDTDKAILYKTDSSGNMQWNKTYGGSGYDYGRSGQQTVDGGYIIGGSTSSYGAGNYDLWLVKTDSKGDEQWNKTFGGSNWDTGRCVSQTYDNGYIFLGFTSSFGEGEDDVWLIKVDANGNMQWNKTYGGVEVDMGYYIMETSDYGFMISGYKSSQGVGYNDDIYLMKTDKDGVEQWNVSFGTSEDEMGMEVRETSDGGFIVLGSTNSYNPDEPEVIWLIKINNTGIMEWDKKLGNNEIHYFGRSLRVTSDGGYIITGSTYDHNKESWQVLLIKTDGSGNIMWENTYGGSGYDSGYSVIDESDGSYVVAGNTDSFGYGKIDILLMKTTSTGDCYLIGELASKNLINGQSSKSFENFECNVFVPKDASIEIQFSIDQINWYNFQSLENGNNIINLTDLHWEGPSFYYKLRMFSFCNDLPEIYYINLAYTKYYSEGYLISTPFNSGFSSSWKEINWSMETPENTDIKFQVKTGENMDELLSKQYSGPDGTNTTFYEEPGEKLRSDHLSDKWIQLKAFFLIMDTSKTPTLFYVYINYNNLPLKPILKEPINDSWTINNNPRFNWEYSDPDSNLQNAFQWQVDDDQNFTSIDYDSGEVVSNIPFFLPENNISDGNWYWRVKTQDQHEDWGPFSEHRILKIDTTPPETNHIPISNVTEGKEITISIYVIDRASGVSEVTIYYKHNTDQAYSNLTMDKDKDNYTVKILVEVGTSESLGYYFKAKDRSSPANLIYHGLNGETQEEPTQKNDLEIKITRQPDILRYSPTGINISVYEKVEITFKDEMDREKTMKAFSIFPQVEGKFTWNYKELTFEPLVPLDFNVTYTVTISNNARFFNGEYFTRNYNWSFKTMQNTDTDEDDPSKLNETNNGEEIDYSFYYLITGLIIICIIILAIVMMILRKKRTKERIIFEKSKTIKPVISHQNQTSQVKQLSQKPQIQPQVQSSIQPQSVQSLQQYPTQFQPIQQQVCLTCGQPLTFYSQNNRFYCHQCKKYV